jgi:hypothetical protein
MTRMNEGIPVVEVDGVAEAVGTPRRGGFWRVLNCRLVARADSFAIKAIDAVSVETPTSAAPSVEDVHLGVGENFFEIVAKSVCSNEVASVSRRCG